MEMSISSKSVYSSELGTKEYACVFFYEGLLLILTIASNSDLPLLPE